MRRPRAGRLNMLAWPVRCTFTTCNIMERIVNHGRTDSGLILLSAQGT